MSLILVSGPNNDEVLTLAELKAYLVDVPDTGEDAELTQARDTAVRELEDNTGRAYSQRTYDMVLDCFPAVIYLPKPPLVSVTSVKYIDQDDVTQTVNASEYKVYSTGDVDGLNNRGKYGGYIKPINEWPSDIKEDSEVVIVRFVAGYSSPTAIPPQAKRGARMKAKIHVAGSVDMEAEEAYRREIYDLVVYSFV